MKKITILGSSNAVPDKDHQNTHLIIEAESKVILIDCPGNPFVRLDEVDINPNSITDLIITHFHPDHVTGLPLLLIDMWLTQRDAPLTIFGLPEVIDKCKKMMALYDWEDWEDFYPVTFQEINVEGISTLFEVEDIRVQAAPVCHLIPSIGIKAIFREGSICYSGDTAPCGAVVDLARDCSILIHEASGDHEGHSTAAEAAKIAQAAAVQHLFLIHYPVDSNHQFMIDEAKAHFSGDIFVAEDLMAINISQ